jgi:hypothetical protein
MILDRILFATTIFYDLSPRLFGRLVRWFWRVRSIKSPGRLCVQAKMQRYSYLGQVLMSGDHGVFDD